MSGPVSRADVPDYIDAMDICVLPDSNEFGSPIVLFEFMVMGKPIVGPDVAPVRDVITHGKTGWTVSRSDAADLRSTVEHLLADPALASRVGQAGRRRALECHTWPAVGRVIERVAANALERRAALGAPTMEAL